MHHKDILNPFPPEMQSGAVFKERDAKVSIFFETQSYFTGKMLTSGKERTQFAKHTAVAMMLAGWDGAGGKT